ncbi:hypothetical protein [Hyphobacterium sp.]|uniref:hypothetical protein n=1 Tax=Hyphobacterium sp. TaxID=2004662 RepID=UPI003BAA2325
MRKTLMIGVAAIFTGAFATTGADAPEHFHVNPDYLVGLDEVAVDDLFTARAASALGDATGSIERFYLDDNGQIEALRIRWNTGMFDESFTLTQPAERFAFDSDTGLILADAEVARLAEWAAEDERLERTSNGIDIERVSPARLHGSSVQAANGRTMGRVVDFEYAPNGELDQIILVQRQGLFRRVVRTEIPAEQVRWSVREQAVRLVTPTSA